MNTRRLLLVLALCLSLAGSHINVSSAATSSITASLDFMTAYLDTGLDEPTSLAISPNGCQFDTVGFASDFLVVFSRAASIDLVSFLEKKKDLVGGVIELPASGTAISTS
jgi:hypothetical protein